MTCKFCNTDITDEKYEIDNCNHIYHINCWKLIDVRQHSCVHCKTQHYNEHIKNVSYELSNESEYVCIVGSFMRIVGDYIRRMNYVIHNAMISGYFWEMQNFDSIRNNSDIRLQEISDYDSDFYNMEEIKMFVATLQDGTRKPILLLKHKYLCNFIITKIANTQLFPQLYIYLNHSNVYAFNTITQLIINSSIETSDEFEVLIDNKTYIVNIAARTMTGNDENYFVLPYSNHQITNA